MSRFVSFISFVVLLLVCYLSQIQSGEVCQSLQQHDGSHCQPWDNCTGLNCFNSLLKENVSFVIDKCSDPLVVHITVSNSTTEAILKHIVYKSSDKNVHRYDSEYGMSTTFGRNASHAHIKIIDEGDTVTIFVPTTHIPLNSSDCMCESLSQLSDNIDAPVETDCGTKDDECVGLECHLSVEDQQYLLETEVYPCATPPGFLYIVSNADTQEIVFYEFFDHSINTTLFGLPFNVEVRHLQYSMIVHGVLDVDGEYYNVIPETQIILDKEKCPVEPSVTPLPTSITPATPTVTTPTLVPTATPTAGISPETCESLKQLASRPPPTLGTCTTNKACDTISCDTFNGYHSQFTFVPCDNPPAIHALITDEDNNVVYDGLVTNKTEIPLGPFETSLIVLVDNQPGEMIVEVKIKVFPFGELPFLPKTSIPIDECQCVQKNRPYPSNCQTHPPSSSPTSQAKTGITPVIIISAVSVVVVVIVGLIVITIITILCIVRIVKKRSSGYSFHRMSMRNVQEEDDTEVVL